MGLIQHDAVIVSSFAKEHIEVARAKAIECMASIKNEFNSDFARCVSEIIESPVNGYVHFMIAPDGSKEGWSESDNGGAARAAFFDWVKSKRGGPPYIDVVHICFGELDCECGGPKATRIDIRGD